MKLVRPALLSVCWLSLVAVAVLPGCSGDRRLSEKETLDYKRELIRRGELNASQWDAFGADTRRKKSEIDALYNQMSAESAVERAKERAYWEEQLRRDGADEAEGLEEP